LLPLTMVLVFGATLWVWADLSDNGLWNGFSVVSNWVLGLIGAVFALGFLGIAVYGFVHRRRLVGYLVVDPMAGA
jgi:hypothetical protein